jgi:hypothetical protein
MRPARNRLTLDLDISDRAVRLYAVLARYADSETHKAYPSRGTLAERLRCSKASIDRAAQELVDSGAMKKKQRHNSSVVYTLQVSPPVTRGVLTSDEGGSSGVMRGVLTGDDLTRTTELEPKERELLNSKFDKFWAVYPKKTDKRLALKSFVKALKRETLEPILDGAKRYRDDPNRDDSFTKNPSTWLNADAWENGPEPVRGRKLTNAENAALLAQKYRGQEQVKAIESPDVDFGGMLKGVN